MILHAYKAIRSSWGLVPVEKGLPDVSNLIGTAVAAMEMALESVRVILELAEALESTVVEAKKVDLGAWFMASEGAPWARFLSNSCCRA